MPEALQFGPFVLEPDRRLLSRDGASIELGQRAADLLLALVQAKGAALTKAELLDAAWPDSAVEEGNLTVQIAQLRKVLGTDDQGRELIVTVPRVGYRLVTAPAASQDWPRPTCAVLPFQNLSGVVADDYFADGIVADIITALSRFHHLGVLSRNSTLVYRGKPVDVREVAATLGAAYVLEGSVRRSNDRLRLTAQLVEGQSGVTLWTDRFEGGIDDIFDFQDRITEAVATVVVPAIRASELDHLRQRRPDSVATYDIHLRARALLTTETEADNAAAHALLVQALARDPKNPLVLSHLAWTLEHRMTMGWPALQADDAARCVDYAHRALRHAGGDAQVISQAAMGLLQVGKDYTTGMAAIRQAAQTNPNDLLVLSATGVATMHCGDLDEAVTHFQRALQLAKHDPDVRFALTGLAMICIMRGQFEAALDYASRSLTHNDRFDPTYWMLIAANARLGRHDAAQRWCNSLLALVPGLTLARIRQAQPALHPDRIGAVLEGMRLAGFPEDAAP